MKFSIPDPHYHLPDLSRRISYKPIGYTERKELNCVRSIAGDYPRFHVYIAEGKGTLEFSLHLDQSRTVYEGATAHNGDYDSAVVYEEGKRIQDALAALKPARKNPFAPD